MKLSRGLFGTAILAFALSTAADASAQEVQITEKARAHFRAGVNYLQDPDGARYEEAYREFRTAYAESPSWKILGNLGIAAMKLERDGEAIEAFKKYLAEGGDNIATEERRQFERDLQTLEASIVQIKVSSNPPGASIVDERIPVRGEPSVNRYGPLDGELVIGVRPGHHRVTAKLTGYEDSLWEFDARPAESQTHVFELQKPAAPVVQPAGPGGPQPPAGEQARMERPVPVGVYIGLAATGAFAIGAGVTGVLATRKKGDFEDMNNGTDPAGAETLKEDGQRLNLIADVLLGGAVVAGGVTAVLFFTRPEVPAERDTALRFTPAFGPRAGGMTVSGVF
jgi:hypothetical protein